MTDGMVSVWKVKHVAIGDAAAPEAVFFDKDRALESLRYLEKQGRPTWLFVNEVEEGTTEWGVPAGTSQSNGWSEA